MRGFRARSACFMLSLPASTSIFRKNWHNPQHFSDQGLPCAEVTTWKRRFGLWLASSKLILITRLFYTLQKFGFGFEDCFLGDITGIYHKAPEGDLMGWIRITQCGWPFWITPFCQIFLVGYRVQFQVSRGNQRRNPSPSFVENYPWRVLSFDKRVFEEWFCADFRDATSCSPPPPQSRPGHDQVDLIPLSISHYYIGPAGIAKYCMKVFTLVVI